MAKNEACSFDLCGLNPAWTSPDGRIVLFNADCLDILPHLLDNTIDLGLTDPPFGVGNFQQTSGTLTGRRTQRGKAVTWNDSGPPPEFFDHFRRITKERIVWGANFFNSFEDRGGAIVWVKNQKMPNFSKADIASCTHYQKTEVVTIPWNNFVAARIKETDHPCERPVELYDWCVAYRPCESVMDAFMGSGSTAVAAIKAGKRYIGIERDPGYFASAVERVQKAYDMIAKDAA